MSTSLLIIIIIFIIVVAGGIVLYVWNILKTQKRNRKEVQGNLLCSFFDRVTHDEEIILCNVIDKYKVVPPGGNAKKEASKVFPHGYYLHYGAVKEQPVLDENGEETQKSYSGSIVTKAWWPIGKKPEIQAQVNHAYYNKGDPRPLNPFNAYLPVNTDVAVQALADENALQTLLTHVKYEFESIFKMFEDVKLTAKWQKYLTWANIGLAVLVLASLIVSIMALRK